ncbi:MAG: DUF5320 domain-containing protein [Candidatus Woesearchaeota archaeon]
MPNLDQTGPNGLGPNTGRGLGKCGNPRGRRFSENSRPRRNRRFNQRPNRRFNRNNRVNSVDEIEERIENLSKEMDYLKKELEEIKN